jgi:hypothetical protein
MAMQRKGKKCQGSHLELGIGLVKYPAGVHCLLETECKISFAELATHPILQGQYD